MEDPPRRDILAVYRELHAAGHENLGIVLQAMLRRTPADIESLDGMAPRVRICKGIYVEPPAVALQGFDEVRAAWMAALERLLAIGAYPAIATHDAYLVEQATRGSRPPGCAPTGTSSRCCSACGPASATSWCATGIPCASTSRSGAAGTSTRCGGCGEPGPGRSVPWRAARCRRDWSASSAFQARRYV